ncbi:MAG: adenosylcobinamide-phosphate synthase CbiB [Pseudomonadota bacterium]
MLISLALILDMLVGDPDWLWRRLPHPVVLFGKIIDWFDRRRTLFMAVGADENGRAALRPGIVLLLVLAALSLGYGLLVRSLPGPLAGIVELVSVAILVAQKSMADHVARVGAALKSDGLEGGRRAVSMIVGRDVSKLDESGVRRAAIESLSENFADGTVTPVVWYLIAGLPGIVFFKAVNTVDSMVGHRTPRHEWFGKPGALLDDWMNWPAARLSALVIWVANFGGGERYWQTVVQGAATHRSPNAGWPETGFAVALNLRLGGPRAYGDDLVEADYLNPQGKETVSEIDFAAALSLFWRCCFVLLALVVMVAFASGDFFAFRGLFG